MSILVPQIIAVLKKRNLRGIRDSIPSGYFLGRIDRGEGPVQLLQLKDILNSSPSLTFLELTDTPASYATAFKFMRINAGKTALELAPGIVDITTAERINITDSDLILGTAGSQYVLRRSVDDQSLIISGGNDSGVGANIKMWGSSHGSKAKDFVFRSNVTQILKWDDSENTWEFGGSVGIGIAAPDGTLHVHTGSAGAVTADTNANDLVVENSSHCGITLLSPDANVSSIYFGSVGDKRAADIVWAFVGLTMQIGTATPNGVLRFNYGNRVEGMRLVAGELGIGIATPDGTLHVHTATAGVVAAGTTGDDLIVENSSHCGISILCPDALVATLFFGSPTDNDHAKISANYSGGGMTYNCRVQYIWEIGGSEKMRLSSVGHLGIGLTPNYTLDILSSTAGGRGVNVAMTSTSGTSIYGIYAQVTGSGPTNNFGGYLEASGATNNYGLRINVASSANNLALWCSGTALSHFGGAVKIVDLAGTGSRTVVADANGLLSAP